MAKADYVGLKGDDLLAKAFARWEFNGFDFPAIGEANGCVGTKCISRASKLYLRRQTKNGTWSAAPEDSVGLLSAHLYFKASCGELKQSAGSFNVRLEEFHLTVRPAKTQLLIDAAGASILTGEKSIHINRNTDWGRPDNIDALVAELAIQMPGSEPFTRPEMLLFLTSCRRFTKERMVTISDELMADAAAHLTKVLAGVGVTVDGDATFHGR